MTASDFDRDRDVIFFADTREESIYALTIPIEPAAEAVRWRKGFCAYIGRFL